MRRTSKWHKLSVDTTMDCSNQTLFFFSICTLPVGYPTICHLKQYSQPHLSHHEGHPWCADAIRKALRDILVFCSDSTIFQTFSFYHPKAMRQVTGMQPSLHVSEISLFHGFSSVVLGDVKCCPQKGSLYARLPRNKPNLCNQRVVLHLVPSNSI